MARDTDRIGLPRLVIDPTRCEGIGMCALMAPGIVTLDPWGFPLLDDTPLDRRGIQAAEGAARSCPLRALEFVAGVEVSG
jgi:ferredoxin